MRSNIAQLAGQHLLTFGVSAHSPGPTLRLVALINVAVSCSGGRCRPSTAPPHLIWMAGP